MKAQLPSDEFQRLQALDRYQILDTDSEDDFNEIVRLASTLCGTPMSLIGLIDSNRQWYKAKVGVDANEVNRDLSFCSYALLQDDILMVEDASQDERFWDNPFVTEVNGIRFYAGMPLASPEGYKLGTLCVFDSKPKKLNEDQLFALRILGKQVMKLFELRLKMRELNEERDKANKATLAKSHFLSMMSHEIRTPLNGIIGLTNILIQDHPNESQISSLKLLKFSGENLLGIINDILDFSKIEANKLELEFVDVNVYNLLNNVIQILKPKADSKGIELKLEWIGNVPRVVKTDSVRLTQVITNLVGNAIKFTEKGAVELVVRTKSSSGKKHQIEFLVKDTGIGIAQENLQTIFDIYKQEKADTARKFGGTGLGLSISKALLTLFNSDMLVESKLGVGSAFSFVLEMEEGSAPGKDEQAVTSAVKVKQGLKVLIVDDNAVNQIVARNILSKWGVAVEIAGSGIEALDKIKDRSFDVVLMDLQMPDLDGFETTKRIRAMDDPYFKSLPIIALTANAMQEIKDKTMESGMSDFLSKPFQPEALKEKIKQVTT